MTREEFGKVAAILKAAYEKDKFLSQRETMEVWYMLLKDMPYEVAKESAVRHMRTCKFPPTPAEIIGQAVDAIMPEQENWSCEWENVQKLISKYGIWDEQAALAEMKPMTQIVVKRLGFKSLCLSENVMADRANFRTIYEQEQNRMRNKSISSAGFKELMDRSNALLLE